MLGDCSKLSVTHPVKSVPTGIVCGHKPNQRVLLLPLLQLFHNTVLIPNSDSVPTEIFYFCRLEQKIEAYNHTTGQ